ncbi:hypothetical protein [Streptomyces sp. 5-10]|uniref:hypothetical protein n=1 Tax=Streptomyces sp. 5-10 TaxID=878925 RepID=UPI00168A629B|nr:hypothetical protein [Streptomyces sp. 5-10]MBD3004755.1 hypothetical protein [Streptomyces sp. 5-10]
MEQAELKRLTRYAASLTPPIASEGEAAAEASKKWDAAWEKVKHADPTDFRTNHLGLWALVKHMGKFGMTCEALAPELPQLEDFGLGFYPLDPDELQEGEKFTAAEQEFLQAREAVRTQEATHGPIPVYKFDSDYAWLITPREIRCALKRYDKASEANLKAAREEIPFWDDWITFLRRVPERGGMRLC